MQVDFVEPQEFEFGPDGPIKVGGGFNLQFNEDVKLLEGEIPFDLHDTVCILAS